MYMVRMNKDNIEDDPKRVKDVVGVPIPKRCVLKCRNLTEVVLVTKEGGMVFICGVHNDMLRKYGRLPDRLFPNKKKEKKS